MGLFNTILQKLGFVKDKAVEAVAGENAAAAEAPVSPVEAAAVETVAAAPSCSRNACRIARNRRRRCCLRSFGCQEPTETQLENFYC